ncbi:MAG: GNAT family N-acetyltransferase [Thermofilaceae archaeon]
MIIRLSSLNYRVWRQLTNLYSTHRLAPHCYLIYDLLYEPENTDLILSLEGGRVKSYALVWKGEQKNYSIHFWRIDSELLSSFTLKPARTALIQLYEIEENYIEKVVERLSELGFNYAEVKSCYDMVCDEQSFKPYDIGQQVRRLMVNDAELFVELNKSRGVNIGLEEAKKYLTKFRYYGLLVNGTLASIASRYLTLRDVHIIGDVYTKPEYRGRGYAKAVTSEVTREAVSSGATALLHVEKNNEAAIKVYKSLGFKIISERPWINAES